MKTLILSMVMSSSLAFASDNNNVTNANSLEVLPPKVFIQELMTLRRYEAIPQNILIDFSSIDIAKNLVYRKYLKSKDDPKVRNFAPAREARINLHFQEEYLKSIQSSCFQNIHQTGHSRGLYDIQRRLRVESTMMGTGFAAEDYALIDVEKRNELLPKYAYFDVKPFSRKDASMMKERSHYGNIIAVLKKDVHSRSTWTSGDSLDEAEKHGVQWSQTFLGEQDANPFVGLGGYYEAQIWGKLCLSDVDYILVNCPGFHPVAQDSIETFKQMKIPVFKCEWMQNTTIQGFRSLKTNPL